MTLLKLEDLDFQADLMGVGIEDISGILFYIVDWADSRGFINKDSLNYVQFSERLNQVRQFKLSIVDFVNMEMDFKLSLSMFDKSLHHFLELYVLDSDYTLDQIHTIGNAVETTKKYCQPEEFYKRIDEAFETYK